LKNVLTYSEILIESVGIYLVSEIKARRVRCMGLRARIIELRNAYRILVGNPEGKRKSGRPRRRTIKECFWIDLKEMGVGSMD
jgi:hypothetical protein